jgi:hypothetical protein
MNRALLTLREPSTITREDVHVISRRLLMTIAPLVLLIALLAGCGGSGKKGNGYLSGPGQVTAMTGHSTAVQLGRPNRMLQQVTPASAF